ncbi:hypothetical protein Pfo_031477 [Paulownia fortunei]|nr:hypothetical protein Pfo_031477 [Paulownia fortunei]
MANDYAHIPWHYFSFNLGCCVGCNGVSQNKFVRGVSTTIIYIFRGLPLMVLAFFIYIGLPGVIGAKIPAFTAGVLTLVLNEGAYTGAFVRGGFEAVEAGQMEAARSLGLTFSNSDAANDAFEAAFKSVQSAAKQLSQYIGHVGESATALLAALEADLAAEREFEKVYVYAHQIFDQDTTNPKYAAYNAQVQSLYAELSAATGHNFLAKTRHYDSARQAAVSGNNIPESVFQTLTTTVDENLPLLHRFVALRKKILGVDDVHSYDLYVPLVDEIDFDVTYEKAQQIVLSALAPLGADYVAIVQKAFDERWIDVVENKGKRTGAYSSGAYDTKPFILLNWQNNLNNVIPWFMKWDTPFTLI